MITLMKIHHLQYFIALATKANFREAAQVCHVSQPAISLAIKSFEERLGDKLFSRHTNPVQLSPFGERILPHARRIVFEYESMIQLSHEQDPLTGSLRVGVIPTIAPYLLPKIIAHFRKKYSSVELYIEEQLTMNIIDMINANELDVGILATPVEGMTLEAEELYVEEFLLYGANLANKKYALPKDIDLAKLWILQEGHCFRNQILNLCELQKGHDTEINYQAGSIETLINLVDQYGGLTVVPALAAQSLSAARKKKLQLFSSPTPVREVSLVYHKYTIKTEMIDLLGKIARNLVPDHMREKESIYKVPVY